MSFYVGNVAIIKIKPELQQDFSYFFNVEYDKIQDEKFKIFADELKKKLSRRILRVVFKRLGSL